mmetsp:Transcript_12829/g.29983  ORF Transcript_12829/g.29983 Transcript_12829/m.29983 type:complete len:228 (+) Transcript_12829:172-855(+)|eukprot:CAMPEP_0172396912 /NCGR_PEP_ID=MMETSP1061-20121228/27754_1 /TAXON_ID=37318 /ORGANISM="Pseudo-nitzschia pungens, Strain cf. pungens" /LENGTH=227 /DNA_ID=CAMNT_0013128907 /DNA_START=127 /DNA_END=810 /DNA_ORIENTATION=+
MARFLPRTYLYQQCSALRSRFTSIRSRDSFVRNFQACGSSSEKENSDRKNEFPRIRAENPFEILGVSKSATYAEVKQRFLELALKHHPDHANDSEDSKNNMKSNDFIRFRQAFERLKEDLDGSTTVEEKGTPLWTDEEFRAWYYEETGQKDLQFRMDMKTRKEVIDTYNQQAQGGLDRGGMWEMARRMAEEDAFLKENKNKIKRSIGLPDAENHTESTVQRRRRKKK